MPSPGGQLMQLAAGDDPLHPDLFIFKEIAMGSDGANSTKLMDEILSLSVAQHWEATKLEWKLNHVEMVDEPETCLCSHTPIIEVCILKNVKNGRYARVGNICVKKFIGLRSDKVFNCLKRLRNDTDKAANPETIELFYEQGLLEEKDRKFALDTFRKRKLSAKQLNWRRDINKRILNRVKKANI